MTYFVAQMLAAAQPLRFYAVRVALLHIFANITCTRLLLLSIANKVSSPEHQKRRWVHLTTRWAKQMELYICQFMTYIVAQMLRPYRYISKYEMHPRRSPQNRRSTRGLKIRYATKACQRSRECTELSQRHQLHAEDEDSSLWTGQRHGTI